MENGIIPNSATFAARDSHDAGSGDEVVIVNEFEEDKDKEKKKIIPSVKIRLFKKFQSASRPKSKLEFDADDFDVPMQKVRQYKY
jgi:hypothetical protein